MEDDENYFSYDEDEVEMEDEEESETHDILWGTYAFSYDLPQLDTPGMNYETAFFSSISYNATLFYQREMATGMGAWVKKPIWDAQSPYFDALHEYWLSGMYDYLAETRKEREKPEEPCQRGLPAIDRNHLNTRRKS